MTRAGLHGVSVWHVIYRHKCMHVNVYIHSTTKCARTHTRTQLLFKLPMCVCSVAKSCPTLCGSMDCSPPGFSVHGVSQVRILESGAISSSRGSPRPRDRTHVSCIGGQGLYLWATWDLSPKHKTMISNSVLSWQNTRLNSNYKVVTFSQRFS